MEFRKKYENPLCDRLQHETSAALEESNVLWAPLPTTGFALLRFTTQRKKVSLREVAVGCKMCFICYSGYKDSFICSLGFLKNRRENK